jgi:hypothetical protein
MFLLTELPLAARVRVPEKKPLHFSCVGFLCVLLRLNTKYWLISVLYLEIQKLS